MGRVRGIPRLLRGRFDGWESPGWLAGAFSYCFRLEWADAVAEFVG